MKALALLAKSAKTEPIIEEEEDEEEEEEEEEAEKEEQQQEEEEEEEDMTEGEIYTLYILIAY